MVEEEFEGVLAGLEDDLGKYRNLEEQRRPVYERILEGVGRLRELYRSRVAEPTAPAEPVQELPPAEAPAAEAPVESAPTPAAEPETAPQPPEQAQETAPPPKSS